MTDTIFMIHGMFGGAWCWDNYRNFFEAKGYQCITPYLRFHDADPTTPPHPQLGTLSLQDYAEDLDTDIKKLATPPIIMGHSMGGLLAQILGSRVPAQALVLLTPAAPRGIMALSPSTIRTFWSGLSKYGFWRKPFRMTFDEVTTSMLQLFPLEEQKVLYSKFVHESGRAAAEIGLWILDQRKASEVDASKITCPILVIAGGKDRATPASIARKVAQKYGTLATYKEFIHHSHWVIGEPGWLEIAEYIDDWLNQVPHKG